MGVSGLAVAISGDVVEVRGSVILRRRVVFPLMLRAGGPSGRISLKRWVEVGDTLPTGVKRQAVVRIWHTGRGSPRPSVTPSRSSPEALTFSPPASPSSVHFVLGDASARKCAWVTSRFLSWV